MGERMTHRLARHALATYAYFGCSLLLLNYRMDFTSDQLLPLLIVGDSHSLTRP